MVAAPQRITLAPTRTRIWLVALLLVLAAVGWWWSMDRMSGMDEGPWTGLGTLGWFLGFWVAMMAAMMLPSATPAVTLYSRLTNERAAPVVFAAGYLLTWIVVGLFAFAFAATVGHATNDVLAWNRAGRWVAGAALLAAAVYELTPLKDACLGKCRSPLGFLLTSWRDGALGALRMGAEHGVACVGCCWALMVSLFALGVMSVTWMVVVAAIIAFEKLIRWRVAATFGTAAVLVLIGVLVLAAPHAVPALTVPG